jgi:hypothetical protein
MVRWVFVFLSLVLPAATGTAAGQHALTDPITDYLFAPDLLLRHADEVGLDSTQKQFILSQARDNRQRYAQMQQELQRQMTALADIVRQEHPDEQQALAQLDKVLAAEREIKRAQLSMALSIRDKLSAEQQAKAKELRQKYPLELHRPPAMDSMRAKFQQVQDRIRKLQSDGRDTSSALAAVQQCKQLMQDGKQAEAEAAIDRLLAEFAADEKK